MKLHLWNLSLEVTRKCNIKCEHCMRGNAQNINMTKEIVDKILDNEDLIIDVLLFSGGEPTLNEELIIYTIDKIIDNNLDVISIAMVTNGSVYKPRLVRAFQRFNEYRNKRIIEMAKRNFVNHPDLMEDFIKSNLDKSARVTFSTDQFHGDMHEVIKEYKKNAPELRYTFNKEFREDELIKTGRSTKGTEFTFKLNNIRYYLEDGIYRTFDYVYVTALGNYEGDGMGSYKDMDRLNMGNVFEKDITDLLIEYGNPVFDSPAIEKKLSYHQ